MKTISDYKNLSDEALIELVLKKENKAFDEFTLRHYRKIYRILTNRIHQVSIAEELTQETFLQFYVYVSEKEHVWNGVLPLLIKIGMNIYFVFLTYLKAQKRQALEESIESHREALHSIVENPEEIAIGSQLIQIVDRDLCNVKSFTRRKFEDSLAGENNVSIAKKYGGTPSGWGATLHTVRKMLKVTIANQGYVI